jgi:putative transposase
MCVAGRRPSTINHNGEGHVDQGPFQSVPVEGDERLCTACGYVERHPVRAGLVERAEDWVWGSARARLHADDPRTLPLCDWPLPQPADWLDRVNQALTGSEIDALRRCAERGRPYGSGLWVQRTARHLSLESTLRSRGRPSKKKV